MMTNNYIPTNNKWAISYIFNFYIPFMFFFFAVAPDQPKIYFEYGNSIEKDHPENYQQDSGNLIVIDEGNLTITLICRVSGGNYVAHKYN